MAKLKRLELEDGDFIASFRVSKTEYDSVARGGKHFLLVPLASLVDELTVGAIGNSFHLMLPKKVLREKELDEGSLAKKAGSMLIEAAGETYLVSRLSKHKAGAPHFED